MPAPERQLLLDEPAVSKTLISMAQGILSQTPDASKLVLIGVQRRGVELAARLAALVNQATGGTVRQGALDITLYRDDIDSVGMRPLVGPTHLPGNLDGCSAWIIDDVLYTGRTIRAALDELIDFGRPGRIGLAVLVDRGGRELPIQADVVGMKVDAGRGKVAVMVKELDGRDAVELVPESAA